MSSTPFPSPLPHTCYLKAIAVSLDPFESRIVFEQNYASDELTKARLELSRYEDGSHLCRIYEMHI